PFTAGTGPISVTASATTLYVTNLGSGNVSAYSIDSTTGATTQLDKSPFSAGTSPVSATIDPARTFLYVCNQTAKNINKFTTTPDGGGLHDSTVAATINTAPASITFTKKG